MGGGGVEKWRLKLTSAKVEVEVEAELGNNDKGYFQSFFYTQTQWTNSSFQADLRSTSCGERGSLWKEVLWVILKN